MNWTRPTQAWLIIAIWCLAGSAGARELYVAPDGSDTNAGTKDRPLATLDRARRMVQAETDGTPITVYLRGGTYELAQPVIFQRHDSGAAQAPITYRSYPGEHVVISGGKKLSLNWRPLRDGILQADLLSTEAIDQLFVNGTRQWRARWPDHKPNSRGVDIGYTRGLQPVEGLPISNVSPSLLGYPALVYDPAQFTTKRWSHPEQTVIHVFQSKYWGNLQWRLRGIDYATRTIQLGQGGWQVGTLWWEQRANTVGRTSKFFIEGALEELDSPGEWLHDAGQGLLFYRPATDVNLARADVVGCKLKQLIVFEGTAEQPVRHVRLQGLTFSHTVRTLLDVYEDRLRGDWAITRQAAVKFDGAEDCTVHDCRFVGLGGNAVFLSNYNRRVTISDSLFRDIGDSAVAVVGSDSAVRSLKVHEKYHVPLTDIDTTIGPQGSDYPGDCRIHNNLMYDLGVFGKQVAGVFLSACQRMTVSHNTVCRLPRAGICINDGCWGGHIIEFNDVSMTVRETSDHGPLNAWGRDRYWQSLHREGKSCDMSLSKKYALLDNHLPTHIRNNRFAHPTNKPARRAARSTDDAPDTFSWGIDLDDGSSNYRVYNNLCLGMSIKLREGYYRAVENNIFIGPHPPNKHAGFQGSDDTFVRNIYVNTKDGIAWCRGPAMRHLPAQMDYNLYFNYAGEEPNFRVDRSLDNRRHLTWDQWQKMGIDQHSVWADPLFLDPARGDFRVQADSPAQKLGFENFPMDRFGTLKPEFQPIIRQMTETGE